jgi:hypothetical protein
MKKLLALFTLLFSVAYVGAAERPAGWMCEDGECAAMIAETKYYGWDAYRLTDGKTEAIVVPAVGRVMSFKRVGEKNWLWSAREKGDKITDWGGWKNWGGEKTWLSPQGNWDKFSGAAAKWPPPKQWEQMPFRAEVVSGGHLKITGAVATAMGVRIVREFWHEPNGDFMIKQTAEKLRGAVVNAGIWNVTQIDGAGLDAVFVPRAAQSEYSDGFLDMGTAKNATLKTVTPTLLHITPTTNGSFKIGTDAPVAAIAAVRDGWAFVMTSSRPDGEYPDGAPGKSGTPVQLYARGEEKMNYLEMELLSPLRSYVAGARWTQTVRWHLEKMPSENAGDSAVQSAIEKLFTP